jgi:parallel beta-helix repeat protein
VKTSRRAALAAILGLPVALATTTAKARQGVTGRVSALNANLRRRCLKLRPLGAEQDDWPRLMAIAQQNAYHTSIVLLPGLNGEPWLCRSVVDTPSGTTFIGTPDTRIEVSLGTANVSDAAFQQSPYFEAIGSPLAEDTVQGSPKITVMSPVPRGSVIALSTRSGQRGSAYTVKRVRGSGPCELTLDRPVLLQYLAEEGAHVTVFKSRAENITIRGEGMVMSGVAANYINFVAAYRCFVGDITFDASAGVVPESHGGCALYDTFSVDSVFAGLRARINAKVAVRLASCENCVIVDCVVSNAGIGIGLTDCARCLVTNCDSSDNNANGVLLFSDGSDLGCESCAILGGTYNRNAYGIECGYGTARTTIEGVACNENMYGILLGAVGNGGAGTAPSRDTRVCQSTFTANWTGLGVESGVKGTVVDQVVLSENIRGLRLADEAKVSDLSSASMNDVNHVAVLVEAGDVTLERFRIATNAIQANATNWVGIESYGNLTASNGTVVVDSANAYAFVCRAGTMVLRDIVVDGIHAASACGAYVQSGSTLKLLPSVDLSACGVEVIDA